MRLLGVDQPLAWEQQTGHVAVRIPTSLSKRPAWVVKVGRG